jgi:hypothetical protein
VHDKLVPGLLQIGRHALGEELDPQSMLVGTDPGAV